MSVEQDCSATEQLQLSQPVSVGEVLWSSDHLCGPLDPLQQVRVFLMFWASELNVRLQVVSQSGADGDNHLPRPAGHPSFDAAKDMAGFPGCKHTLPGVRDCRLTDVSRIATETVTFPVCE